MGAIRITAKGFVGKPEIKVYQQEVTFGDPLENMQIRRNRASNLFGKVRNNNTKNHQGFDYYAPVGTDTFAVADGEIVHIVDVDKDTNAYGKQAVLKIKGSKYFAFYAHLSKISVALNAKVKKGDAIGKTGISGNAKSFTGKDQHLHVECRTSAILGRGLSGRFSPNKIVETKFYSENPNAKSQGSCGVLKVDKNKIETKMDIIW